MKRMPAGQRRELLLQAAWRVLTRSGVAAATTRAICAEAGMPQASFHYCFASRDDLLREVMVSLLPVESAAALATVDGQGTLPEAVHRALLSFWALVEADPGAHQVLFEITLAAVRSPHLAGLAVDAYRRYVEGALGVISALSRAHRVRWDIADTELARAAVAGLDGITLHYLVDRDAAAARAGLGVLAQDLAAHGIPVPAPVGAFR